MSRAKTLVDVAMKRSAALSKERRAFKKLDEVTREHEAVERAVEYVRRRPTLVAAAGGLENLERAYARVDTRLDSARLAWLRAVNALAKLEVEKKA